MKFSGLAAECKRFNRSRLCCYNRNVCFEVCAAYTAAASALARCTLKNIDLYRKHNALLALVENPSIDYAAVWNHV